MPIPTATNGIETPAVPYGPTVGWYRRYLGALRRGEPEAQAVAAANSATGMREKAFSRLIVADAQGASMLSLPVEGSARVIKTLPPCLWRLSDHGDWPRTHPATLSTLLGRLPFHDHLMPELLAIYAGKQESLAEFTAAIHRLVCDTLGLDALAGAELTPEAARTANEWRRRMADGETLLPLLFRHGPDLLFALL